MPNIKSAKKRVLLSEARRVRNKDKKTELKTVLKRVRADLKDTSLFVTAVSKLDKAAGKGLIHKNKAARLKSRLAAAAKSTSKN